MMPTRSSYPPPSPRLAIAVTPVRVDDDHVLPDLPRVADGRPSAGPQFLDHVLRTGDQVVRGVHNVVVPLDVVTGAPRLVVAGAGLFLGVGRRVGDDPRTEGVREVARLGVGPDAVPVMELQDRKSV